MTEEQDNIIKTEIHNPYTLGMQLAVGFIIGLFVLWLVLFMLTFVLLGMIAL